jgi:hypothetical protein
MSKRVPVTAMLSVYDGQRSIGFVLARSKSGHEAFDVEGTSLGLYPKQKAAMAAVSAAATTPAEAGNREE